MRKDLEWADLQRLLDRLRETDGITPNAIARSEKPDFILTVGEKQVGVEVTRSVYEERLRALKLQRAKSPSTWCNLSNCVDYGPRRSSEDLLKSVTSLVPKAPPLVPPLVGFELRISKALAKKRSKLESRTYSLFDENWLLIYDIFPPIIDEFRREEVQQRLLAVFQRGIHARKDFDKVYIIAREFLFRWSDGNLDWATFDDPALIVI